MNPLDLQLSSKGIAVNPSNPVLNGNTEETPQTENSVSYEELGYEELNDDTEIYEIELVPSDWFIRPEGDTLLFTNCRSNRTLYGEMKAFSKLLKG